MKLDTTSSTGTISDVVRSDAAGATSVPLSLRSDHPRRFVWNRPQDPSCIGLLTINHLYPVLYNLCTPRFLVRRQLNEVDSQRSLCPKLIRRCVERDLAASLRGREPHHSRIIAIRDSHVSRGLIHTQHECGPMKIASTSVVEYERGCAGVLGSAPTPQGPPH